MTNPPIQLLLFARYPVPGRAKTRLIPALGPEGAARLHRRMTEHAVRLARVARKASMEGFVGITVCCTGAPLRDFRAWLGSDLRYTSQPPGDLGERMGWAFDAAFLDGAKFAVAVGTDVPDVTPRILCLSFEGLRTGDVVLGPATDGGYYLIGMGRPHPALFAHVAWGTEQACAQTRNTISRLGLKLVELPLLNDVDRPEDLCLLREDPRFSDVFTGNPLVSVIIPTLNEENAISRVLTRVRSADAVEVIVADGGSQDNTRHIAAQAGALVLEVSGGRAAQQNAGADASKGRLLLFLHADTLPPESYPEQIRMALDNPSTVAGAFRFQTDGPGKTMRLVEWAANLRSGLLRWPYGDQGLFMERRVFEEAGGFPPLPIMEDFELVRRLRRRGPVVTLGAAATTSARRWERMGVLRTTLINQLMVAFFLGGVPAHRLTRLYRTNRSERYQSA